jgi:Cu-Zn family superoxide dismutase
MIRTVWLAGSAFLLSVAVGPARAADDTAEAKLAPTQGNTTAGTVTFKQAGNKVQVTARVTGLAPGSHGFHVHEKGDCSAPDATSAGGHFNPGGSPHGHPQKGAHHAGDMPMLVADASGKAELTAEMTGVALAAGPASLVGKAVIVHAAPDDYTTQPTGNSGARVACGVIALRR